MTPNWKPSRTARKKAEKKKKTDRKTKERQSMDVARKADRGCRFPLCGCKKLGLRVEVAHLRHRGMGGNPKGDRTQPDNVISLCTHRHQHGAVSLHKGTLRIEPLTDAGTRGPVAFYIDRQYAYTEGPDGWFCVAHETSPGMLAIPLTSMQLNTLGILAEMDL